VAELTVEEHGAATDEQLPFARGVRSIGLASFLADVGHEIPTALLPSFLTSTLGAPAAPRARLIMLPTIREFHARFQTAEREQTTST